MAGRTRKFNPVLSEQDKTTLEKIVLKRFGRYNAQR